MRVLGIDLAAQVDAPLGWPLASLTAVTAHERHEPWPGTEDRRSLTHRLTDDVVRDNGWGNPMSASADKLGSVAAPNAVAARSGATRAPETDDERRAALVEGWIHVPTGALSELRPQ